MERSSGILNVQIESELGALRGVLRIGPLDDQFAVPWGCCDEEEYQNTGCEGGVGFSSFSDSESDGCCLEP